MYRLVGVVLAGSLLSAAEWQIRTVAGNGEATGPAAGATAEGSPVGLGWATAFDSQDRLHITTIAGGVWRINAEGAWEHVWQGEPAAIQFGLAIDEHGRVFTANMLTGVVTRIDVDGTSSQLGPAFEAPTGLAVDAAGNVFVAEPRRIRVMNAQGAVGTYVDGVGGGALSLDRDGNLYASEFNGGVTKIAPDRSIAKLAAAGPIAVTACASGAVFFADLSRILRIGADGPEVIAGSAEQTFAGETGPAADARFKTPLALACDSAGRVAVYDSFAARLRLIHLQ